MAHGGYALQRLEDRRPMKVRRAKRLAPILRFYSARIYAPSSIIKLKLLHWYNAYLSG
jgi:hypothetical protein